MTGKVIAITLVVVHLLFAALSIIHEVKYYRHEDWEFDNEDISFMITTSLCFGFFNWIACITTYKIEGEKKTWKITNWFNKLVEKKDGI